MVRVVTERRSWVIVTLVVLSLLVVLVTWGASQAPARASRLIEARLGVEADVEAADLSLGGVALSGLKLESLHGGFSVRVEHLKADVNLIAAAFQGARAVRGLSARGVSIDVDGSDEGLAESIASVRQKIGGKPGKTADRPSQKRSSGGRAYDASDITVRIRDAQGPLVELVGARMSKEGDRTQTSVSETTLGTLDSDHAAVGPVQVELRRIDGSWKLRELNVENGSVRALRDDDGVDQPLALRLRNVARQLRGTPEERAASPEPANPDPAEEGAPEPEVGDPSARLFARLSPDARIAVSNVRIESRASSDGPVERIEGFGVAVRGEGDGWYRVEVDGRTSNRGTLQVDMSLHPEEARAEGSVELRGISLALIAPFAPELPLYEAELGKVSAQLDLVAGASDHVSLEGVFRVRELALADERIAAEPVRHINVGIRGKGAWFPDERRLAIERGVVQLNEARLLVEGELERTTEHYRIDLLAKLPPTDCNDVVGAIPKDVLGSLSRFEWDGNWSALGRLALDSRDLEATELEIRVRNLCTFERTPRWVAVERFQQPFRHRAVEPDETVFQMVTGPGTDNWVAFADISPFVVPAVISHEDGGFFDHAGFAPWAIRDALVRNLEEGRYVVGASTISMQLAKNLYLQREKTIARKAQEVILTWWLENALTKDQILELYLNVIEYGPSVYGLRPAAAYYFGRPPSELSPAEAAFLACVLPSPKRYYVSYERGALTRPMKNRMRRLLEHMVKRERIGPEALAYGLAELDDFRFHREGDLPPRPRFLPPLGAPVETDPNEPDPFESLFVAP